MLSLLQTLQDFSLEIGISIPYVEDIVNKLKYIEFIKELDKAVSDLKMRSDLPHRYLNEGFSGGEKKRNEILQMMQEDTFIPYYEHLIHMLFDMRQNYGTITRSSFK